MARPASGGRPTAVVTAKTSLGASTKYEVVVTGLSYGRCVKKWEDFSDLYDSLHLRYADTLGAIPFPLYTAAKKNRLSKKEAVEENRTALEGLVNKLLRHPRVSQDADVHDFLHISDSFAPVKVRNGRTVEAGTAQEAGPDEALRNKAGPTPFTVRDDAHAASDSDAEEAGSGDEIPSARSEVRGGGSIEISSSSFHQDGTIDDSHQASNPGGGEGGGGERGGGGGGGGRYPTGGGGGVGGESGKMSEAQHVRQNTAGKIMNKPMPPPLKKAQKLLITRAFGDDGVKGGGVGEVATSSPGEKLGDKHLTRGTVQRGEEYYVDGSDSNEGPPEAPMTATAFPPRPPEAPMTFNFNL